MEETNLKDVYVINLQTFEDDRGFFKEIFRLNELEQKLGRRPEFVRLNHSRSNKDVLRGIHVANFEKLVYCTRGKVFVALVDTRKDSPSFGEKMTLEIGDHKRAALYLPAGIGNSFFTLSDEADYVYLVTKYYDPSDEITIAWDDKTLDIDWPHKNPILSDRDRGGVNFKSIV